MLSSWLLHVLHVESSELRGPDPEEVITSGHWGSAEESWDKKWQKWDSASMETAENQETVLQWLMMGPQALHGLIWNLSICSLGERRESSGARRRMRWSPGRQVWRGTACPCSAQPSPDVLARLCPASGAGFLTNTEAQELIWIVGMYCGDSRESFGLELSVFSFRKCGVKKRR